MADEIEETVVTFTEPKKFVIVGHSLGGLIARSAVGWLYERGYLGRLLIPVSYVGLAVPHLGVRRPYDVWKYPMDGLILFTVKNLAKYWWRYCKSGNDPRTQASAMITCCMLIA